MTIYLYSWLNHSMKAAESNRVVLLFSAPRKFCQFAGMAAAEPHISAHLVTALHVYYISVNQEGKYPNQIQA